MREYAMFTKKELFEMARTYKLFLMAAVYFLLGVMNPLTAKYTPDLLKNFMPEGMHVEIPIPTAMDSWVQFYKNVPQIGLIVLVLIFSGILVSEIGKGTLVILLTKGLSRKNVILSKFTASSLVWTTAYWFCFFISYGYTIFFWKEKTSNLLFSVSCLWLFGIFLLAVLLFGSTLCRNAYEVLLFTGGMVVFLHLVNIIPKVKKYNPVLLESANQELLTKAKTPEDFFGAVGITLFLILASLAGSIFCFNRKRL